MKNNHYVFGHYLCIAILISIVFFTVHANADSLEHVLKDDFFASTDKEEYEKIIRCLFQKDEQAFKKMLMAGMMSGSIVVLKKGEPVYRVDVEILSGLVKIRRKGDIKELWIISEYVR